MSVLLHVSMNPTVEKIDEELIMTKPFYRQQ